MGVPARPAERRDLQPGADQMGEPPRGYLPHRQIPRGGAHVGHQEKSPHHELRETQPRPQVTRTDHKLIVTPCPHITPTVHKLIVTPCPQVTPTVHKLTVTPCPHITPTVHKIIVTPCPQVTPTDHKLIVTPYPHLRPTDRNWMTPLGIMGSYLVLHLCNILKRIVGSVRLQGTCTQGWAIP